MHIRADTQIACDVLCCFKGWVQRAFLSLLVISTSANTRKRDRRTRTHTQHRWMEGHPALTGVEIQDKDTQDTKTQTPLKVHTRTASHIRAEESSCSELIITRRITVCQGKPRCPWAMARCEQTALWGRGDAFGCTMSTVQIPLLY